MFNEHKAPIVIRFMLYCYITERPDLELSVEWNSIAGVEVRSWLVANGLVNKRYHATKRGIAWIKSICSAPLPP